MYVQLIIEIENYHYTCNRNNYLLLQNVENASTYIQMQLKIFNLLRTRGPWALMVT